MSQAGKPYGRIADVTLAISISNLLLLDIWRKLIFADQFLLPTWSWRDLAAALINISVLAMLVYGLIRLARIPALARYALHRWLCLLPLIIGLNYIRRRNLEMFREQWGDARVFLFIGGLALLLTYALLRWRRKILAAAEFVVLCMIAFLPIAMVEAVWAISHQPPLPVLAKPFPVDPAKPRVVWIIFDEMDWRYVYSTRRPSDLHMTNFDRLRQEAFDAEKTSQAGLKTILAIPSLITGNQVLGGFEQGKDHLFIQAGSDSVDLRDTPTIFSDARQRGINAGVLGWYLPYCRLFAPALTQCYWESLDTEVRSFDPDLRISLASQLRGLSPLEKRQRHEKRYEQMMRQAVQMAADPSLGLVLLHLPVPHGPAIYDRKTGELTSLSIRPNWYLDNLALADRALGDIRSAMEAAGLWDRSTVLVSSDHSLRWYSMINESTDPRIPFLLKMRGQHAGETYTAHINALLSHDLVLAILNGELSEPSQLGAWFDRNERAYMAKVSASAAPVRALKATAQSQGPR